jgi:hypothetical protein
MAMVGIRVGYRVIKVKVYHQPIMEIETAVEKEALICNENTLLYENGH